MTITYDGNEGQETVLRPWEPGDGLHCTFSSRASRNRPCGRPVAVRVSKYSNVHRRNVPRNTVVCSYHLSEQVRPGDLSLRAETAAREKVLAEHWDEYQAAIREYMQPAVEQMIGALSDELKALVLQALAEDDQRGAA